MKKFDLQLFGGGGEQTTKQTRDIPAQSADEAALQSGLMNYSTTGLNNATGLLSSANNAVNNTYNPNWATLGSNYNNTANSVASGYNYLSNGVLPSTYATNRQNALNADLNATVGNALTGLNNRGILNSSVTNQALNDISTNAANTLAKQYSSDISTQSNLLSNQQQSAANTLNANSAAQQGSYYQPSQLYQYASNNYTPASNLFDTLYSGRMGTAGTTQTTSGGGSDSGVAGAVGTLGSAMITCFAAGTMIATPDGEKPIEKIKVGDKVIAVDGKTETVRYVNDAFMCEIVELKTANRQVKTTPTQRFYTDTFREPVYVGELEDKVLTRFGKEDIVSRNVLPAELVYDFTTTGSNSFFANGLAAEGWD